jgi:hypothetical protein
MLIFLKANSIIQELSLLTDTFKNIPLLAILGQRMTMKMLLSRPLRKKLKRQQMLQRPKTKRLKIKPHGKIDLTTRTLSTGLFTTTMAQSNSLISSKLMVSTTTLQ